MPHLQNNFATDKFFGLYKKRRVYKLDAFFFSKQKMQFCANSTKTV